MSDKTVLDVFNDYMSKVDSLIYVLQRKGIIDANDRNYIEGRISFTEYTERRKEADND